MGLSQRVGTDGMLLEEVYSHDFSAWLNVARSHLKPSSGKTTSNSSEDGLAFKVSSDLCDLHPRSQIQDKNWLQANLSLNNFICRKLVGT